MKKIIIGSMVAVLLLFSLQYGQAFLEYFTGLDGVKYCAEAGEKTEFVPCSDLKGKPLRFAEGPVSVQGKKVCINTGFEVECPNEEVNITTTDFAMDDMILSGEDFPEENRDATTEMNTASSSSGETQLQASGSHLSGERSKIDLQSSGHLESGSSIELSDSISPHPELLESIATASSSTTGEYLSGNSDEGTGDSVVEEEGEDTILSQDTLSATLASTQALQDSSCTVLGSEVECSGLISTLVGYGLGVMALGVLLFLFHVWMLIDALLYSTKKIVWVPLIFFFPPLGALVYYFMDKKKRTKDSGGGAVSAGTLTEQPTNPDPSPLSSENPSLSSSQTQLAGIIVSSQEGFQNSDTSDNLSATQENSPGNSSEEEGGETTSQQDQSVEGSQSPDISEIQGVTPPPSYHFDPQTAEQAVNEDMAQGNDSQGEEPSLRREQPSQEYDNDQENKANLDSTPVGEVEQAVGVGESVDSSSTASVPLQDTISHDLSSSQETGSSSQQDISPESNASLTSESNTLLSSSDSSSDFVFDSTGFADTVDSSLSSENNSSTLLNSENPEESSQDLSSPQTADATSYEAEVGQQTLLSESPQEVPGDTTSIPTTPLPSESGSLAPTFSSEFNQSDQEPVTPAAVTAQSDSTLQLTPPQEQADTVTLSSEAPAVAPIPVGPTNESSDSSENGSSQDPTTQHLEFDFSAVTTPSSS